MKAHKQNFRQFWNDFFMRSRKLPSPAVEPAWERVLDRLREDPQDVLATHSFIEDSLAPAPEPSAGRLSLWLAGAATVCAVVLAYLLWPVPAAVIERVEGGSYRVVEGKVQHLRVGEKLGLDKVIYSSASSGDTFALNDSSRVEMREQTELWLEHAGDGVRIHLTKGGVIVNAAKQRKGHLYVQTKDAIVSVVGTVFFVNAEEGGSRVAVIQGEVQVQRGATAQQLLPGEQVSTSPSLATIPVREEISWSRNAAAHMALLQQSAFVRTSTAFQNPTEPALAFEVASIRPRDSSAVGGGGRGDGGAHPPACGGSPPTINPGRFVVTNVTLYRLISMAYGFFCGGLERSEVELLSGGPDWIWSDKFDVEAVIPKDAPTYTRQQLSVGNAPKLQMMLQTLLADRFKLTIRRVLKELPIHALTAGPGAPKLQLWKEGDQTSYGVSTGLNASGQISTAIFGKKLSMDDLAQQLSLITRRPVHNRTGLMGEFNYAFEFETMEADGREMRASGRWTFMVGPSLFTAIEEQLGLKLVATRAPVEILVIERVEKLSEN